MKSYRLSSTSERVAGLSIFAVLLVCIGFLTYALHKDTLSFIICLVTGLLVGAGLGFYVVNLFLAACIPHAQSRRLEVKGLPNQTLDLSQAASLETAAYQNGPIATRVLVFKDRDGEVVATVPTFFTAHQGVQAEPLAIELAQSLGLSFEPTLQVWEYDKEKRKEHEKELAAAEKAARRERFRALKAKILRKTGAETSAPVFSEETVPPEDTEMIAFDGINYDAMDDDK